MRRSRRIVAGAVSLVLGAAGAPGASVRPAAGARPAAPASVALAGVRSSHYGIRPFPSPEEWVRAIESTRGRFPGSTPFAIWIVGGLHQRRGCRLEFPADGRSAPEVAFLDHDKHEPYLDAFDAAGVQVYLQVEPGLADPETLIDLVLARYGHHRSVVGFGVDVEWYRESEFPEWGMKVDDETARRWEARVKAHRPEYRLFLKHWDRRWMPPSYRGDILFVDDSQELAGLDAMVDEFAVWAETFAPNPVAFQVGYRSDRPWWEKLGDPVAGVGKAICARVDQTCGIVWVDFTLRDVAPPGVFAPAGTEPSVRARADSPPAVLGRGGPGGTGRPAAHSLHRGPDSPPIVGVKIYEPVADPVGLLEDWKHLGIDTAFVSAAIAESGTFVPAARAAGVRTLVITPVFFDPDYLEARPDAWAITGRGGRAQNEWVSFVCPSLEEHREEKIRRAVDLLSRHRPDGLSLDFVRHFVFWEKIPPGGRIDPLDTTCFCERCLARFEAETGVRRPGSARSSPTAAAEWLFANHGAEWIRWRAGLVTSWVAGLVRRARVVEPDVVVGVHLVPWRPSDYDDGLRRVAGQDVEALAPLVDYLSPMCYAHMLGREPSWVADVVRDLAARSEAPVLPSIEVRQSYREEELDEGFFASALDAVLSSPSDGVVFWSWPPLAAEAPKREALRRRVERPLAPGP